MRVMSIRGRGGQTRIARPSAAVRQGTTKRVGLRHGPRNRTVPKSTCTTARRLASGVRRFLAGAALSFRDLQSSLPVEIFRIRPSVSCRVSGKKKCCGTRSFLSLSRSPRICGEKSATGGLKLNFRETLENRQRAFKHAASLRKGNQLVVQETRQDVSSIARTPASETSNGNQAGFHLWTSSNA